MKIFVTGINGQLGHDVMLEIGRRHYEGIGSGSRILYSGQKDKVAIMPYVFLDITDKERVNYVIGEIKPDVVIHCAAWTAVDAAEDWDNVANVFNVNVTGTKNVAMACRDVDAKMVYISTDYVFDGTGDEPWDENCARFSPVNMYGRSKLEGENAVRALLEKFFIVRIAWVFGQNRNNFVKTMLKIGTYRDTVRVVNDQIGTPTYTADLARLLVDMVETEKYGNYHATNEGGFISWYDFAVEIYKHAGVKTIVEPVSTIEYGLSKAARPYNSRLSKKKLVVNGFEPLPDWRDAVERYITIG